MPERRAVALSVDGLFINPGHDGPADVLTGYPSAPGRAPGSPFFKPVIDAGGGKALLATMAGETLTATRDGSTIVFTDRDGTRSAISGPERIYDNGVVNPVDAVLTPSG